MGVSGLMFLLVPAYPGCPGQTAVKWLLLLFLHCKYSRPWDQFLWGRDRGRGQKEWGRGWIIWPRGLNIPGLNRTKYEEYWVAWSQVPVGVNTSRQCCSSCCGCQSVSAFCSRSRGCSLESLLHTSQTTVAFCRTLVIAHRGPIPMTCGRCLCCEYITNSVIGVSWPLVVDCGTTFHPDYSSRDLFSTPSDISENSLIWRPEHLVTLLNL